jgi:hypothetical protein
MKTLFLLIISLNILTNCGVKSDPEYQAINKQKITIKK